MRLDAYLVDTGLVLTADEALRSVIAGEVLVDDAVASSAAMDVSEGSQVRIRKRRSYVSRGGDKLKCAIDAFAIDAKGQKCLDIGASSGGFTDCLLQEGAKSVACVDVNYSQLDWKIRNDPRTSVFERTNIKKASNELLGGPFDLVVIDVSFIGLSSLAVHIARFCRSGTTLIALVKPQFESDAGESEGGLVKDPDVRLRCVSQVSDALSENGFKVSGSIESPIKGKKKGNVEYLVCAAYR